MKLSYIVKQIDIDTCIIPKGALKLTSEHEYRINKGFKGLNSNELCNENNYLHFRPIINEDKKLFIENIDSIFSYDILDPITLDIIKGSWSIQLDSTKKKLILEIYYGLVSMLYIKVILIYMVAFISVMVKKMLIFLS